MGVVVDHDVAEVAECGLPGDVGADEVALDDVMCGRESGDLDPEGIDVAGDDVAGAGVVPPTVL